MKLIKDLGMQFATANSKRKRRYGLYECPSCGSEIRVVQTDVKRGNSTQCKPCSRQTHGRSDSKLYRVYYSMKTRCSLKTDSAYKYYGQKGISVCKEWEDSFESFERWSLSNGYEYGLSIDRIDGNGNYEPSNCRWVTKVVQSRNTKKLRSDNSTGYRGVFISGNKWSAYIGMNKARKYIGSFDYPWTAAYAYDSYVLNNRTEHTRNFA